MYKQSKITHRTSKNSSTSLSTGKKKSLPRTRIATLNGNADSLAKDTASSRKEYYLLADFTTIGALGPHVPSVSTPNRSNK